MTILKLAVANSRDTRVIKKIAQLCDNINAQDKNDVYKYTALMSAVMISTPDIVRALIDAGADLNVQDDHGVTALIMALDEHRI